MGATAIVDVAPFVTGQVNYPVTLTFRVTAANAQGADPYLAEISVSVNSDGTYHGIINGVPVPGDYINASAMTITSVPVGGATTPGNCSAVFFNAVNDVSAIDFYRDGNANALGSNVAYRGSFTQANLPASNPLTLRMFQGGTFDELGGFQGNFSLVEGDTVLVIAGGFNSDSPLLQKTANGSPKALGMYVVAQSGAVVALSAVQPTARAQTLDADVTVYPNPANSQAQVRVTSKAPAQYSLHVRDLAGRTVYAANVQQPAGTEVFMVDTRNLAAGLYTLSLQDARGASYTQKLSVVK
jgi:hypothetical protein